MRQLLFSGCCRMKKAAGEAIAMPRMA